MKKALTLLAVFAMSVSMVFGAVSCGGSDNEKPVLKVGMECAYQPYNWTQYNADNGAVAISGKTGQYANGYDVKIAKKIADELGMQLEIYAYEWESLIPAVESGALDFIIAGMSPTDERKEIIDFSDPYYESNLVVVVRNNGNYATAANIAALSGAKIVAQSGTFHDTVVDQIDGVLHQTAMKDFPSMIVALKAGTIDGYIAEEPGAIADCAANSEFTYLHFVNNDTGFTVTDLSNVTLAVGLKKNSDLLTKVNTALGKLSTQDKAALMQEAIDQAAALGV